VLSMNAMLEPRIVAANTQLRDSGLHGLSEAPVRTAASSHDGRMQKWILVHGVQILI